jgi:8-oxo-dGTP pyrophosphatase MutT (NUDIX family)
MDTQTILVIAFAVVVLVFRFVIPVLRRGGGEVFVAGQYSMAGGAVCPRCKLPYSRKTFSPNLLVGKLERCPHCGKLAVVGRASPADLAAAEARLSAKSPPDAPKPQEDDAERLRRQLDDSRFEG